MSDKPKYLQCQTCGARKVQTAEKKCKPHRDYSDEWTCEMTYAKTDEKGRFIK